MRVIVAGTRRFDTATFYPIVDWALRAGPFDATSIISGGASGIDATAEQWGKRNDTAVLRYAADWNRHGRAAGPKRNEAMAESADALILIWDGESKGSADMRRRAINHGLPMYEVIVRLHPHPDHENDRRAR